MPTNGDATGQVPPISSPDSNGQVPPASQVSTDNADNSDSAPSEQDMTPAEYRAALKRANDQAARNRVDAKELAALRAEKEQQNAAKLTVEEKLAAAQAKQAELETQMQERVVRADIRIAASSMGLKPELAYRLLDYAQVEFDGNGDPTNVADLLLKAAQEYGLSVTTPGASNGNGKAARANTQQQQPSGIGATPANPARNTSGGPVGGWSWDVISGMTPEKYDALSLAERAAMAQFIMTHPQARGGR
jgi:hypothetical protein